MKKHQFTYSKPFPLENGQEIEGLTLTYHTAGTLSCKKDNVVWVFHALTANSIATEWWDGLIGEHYTITPDKHFIVCVNILGSCYGSTGPGSINPKTKEPYFNDFPRITIRDMVNCYALIQKELNISEIYLGIGGSMGGYQAMEWAIKNPRLFQNLALIATSPKESDWGKAIHETQRMAITQDKTFGNKDINAAEKGLITARAIGMLTYRSPENFSINQKDAPEAKDNFRAESYIRYQGQKLANRFNAYTYYSLTLAMDSHDVGRDALSTAKALQQIMAKTIVIGIDSDILCPPSESEFLHQHLQNSEIHIIHSHYGHDGFLTEHKLINNLVAYFLKNE